jgi:16S rRNA (cytidine1402-2'-O)-methyltransferase
MERIYSFNEGKGILYLVATPIGNLEDITYRAIRILKEANIIYAEDTRNSSLLLRHYGINTPLLSYHEFNKDIKEDEIILHLKNNETVCIISDAGLPVISDPGFEIAKRAIKEGISVSTIPGPSAGISALIASGLPPKPFTFYGFLESKHTKRKNELLSLMHLSQTIIFYEAPHRIKEMLTDLYSVFGNRKIVIARELTKKFEEYIRGDLKDILDNLDNIKGELVVICEGYKEVETSDIDRLKKIDELVNLGYKSKDAIKEVASMLNLNKSELYSDYVKHKSKDIN